MVVSDHLFVNETINKVRQRDRILDFIPDFKKAYELKEKILWMIQEVHDLESARQRLDAWIQKAEDSKIPEFKTAVRAYRNWKKPILNAFGLRNFDRFRTRI